MLRRSGRALLAFVALVALQQTALAQAPTPNPVIAAVTPPTMAPAQSMPLPPPTDSAATPSSASTLLAQAPQPPIPLPGPAAAHPAPAKTEGCTGPGDPYKNYACLDAYLGQDFFTRLFNYYRLEWDQGGPPTDPNAPPGQIKDWPRIPATVPPMAYTDWPSGAVETMGDTLPNGADSPFMAAISNTSVGQWMQDHHFQLYGWVNGGFNISSNQTSPGGNGPIGYTYTPNTVQLDQAVLYLDRWPDTVQTDHFDWGMRASFLWGQNYRYTNSYGLGSYQFNGHNNIYGWDVPMEYVDLYWPQPFNHLVEGLEIRVGRYISIPDIEAQLAPNNLTYTHSLTYTWDNYTNTGIVSSWQVTKNFMVQLGVTDGTETPIWHNGLRIPNLFGPNPLYTGTDYLKDPGNQPSLTACLQFKWNNGWDTLYPCLDGLNNGRWGYNNLQWHGFTFYHRFNDQWHNDFESYFLSENGVPNLRNPTAVAIFNGGGTPFSPQNVPFNPPNLAYCEHPDQLSCDVHSIGVLDYINYTPNPLNNFTMRLEWYDDPNGWRTGTGGRTQYYDVGFSWQHWLSPQIEMRPEITYWRSIGTAAFNGYSVTGIANNRKSTEEFAADMIFHF
jgi:hypothetical protein